METLKVYSRYFMAILYILAGLNHFRDPDFYLQMMPRYLPAPLFLVQLSGVIEILLGLLLLFKKTQRVAALGIVLFLVAVFPANFYMYQQGGAAFGVSDLGLLIRLPLQLVLIAWALVYTKVL